MKSNQGIRTLGTASLLSLAAALPASAQNWGPTHTLAFDTSGTDVRDNGPLADDAALHVTLSLTLHQRAELDEFIRRTGTPGDELYGHYLTGPEFVSRYGPSREEAETVASYLRQQGFINIVVAPNRLLVSADGSARNARRAFRTELHQFDFEGRQAYANTRDVQVPEHLKGIVLAVLGLQNVAEMHTMLSRAHSGSIGPDAYNPVDFPAAYDTGNTTAGDKTNVGIIVMGSVNQAVRDLRSFESQNGLPQIPVKRVPVDGSTILEVGTDEWDLDSQTIQAMAGGSVKKLYFYMGNPFKATGFGIGFLSDTFNKAVTDNVAKVINASLGSCESLAHMQGVTATDDQIFAQGAAQGQTFVVAAGDGGSNTGCFLHSGLLVQVSYPASSPYVVSVGGTTLTTTAAGSGAYVSESAWSLGGGGFSNYAAKPSWQKTLVSGKYRSVPDVAFDADPNTGANIIWWGTPTTFGGTSLAAPLMTGTLARAQTANNNSLGFAAPLIYSLAARMPAAFHDVTAGSNGTYSAAAGFDQATGLGSPDVASFVSHLKH